MFEKNGEIQKHLLSRDGLHLSFKGTRYVSSVIRDSVVNCLPCALSTSPLEGAESKQ